MDQPVANIVDHLRKFALKERLDAFVKQTSKNVQGNAPTVPMRADYRVHLLDQSGCTFHIVRDQWCGCLAENREVWCL
ncbi:putative 1-phosphatidylinositol-3-phosphate 5-kinase FAB1D [Taenia solium]|eukprot:TsM_000347600 transcript=TsM_000347600 gene=TsM_000347600